MSKFISTIPTYAITRKSDQYWSIPESTINGIIAYVNEGMPVGDFLECVLSNDLMGAHSCADTDNYIAMPQIVNFLYNEIPARGSGSGDHMRRLTGGLVEGD